MTMLVTLRGDAGNYRIKGAIWELGDFAYRAYLHLVPAPPHPDLPRAVVSVAGATLQDVLSSAEARVKSTVGKPVENLEVRAASRELEPSHAP